MLLCAAIALLVAHRGRRRMCSRNKYVSISSRNDDDDVHTLSIAYNIRFGIIVDNALNGILRELRNVYFCSCSSIVHCTPVDLR